MIIWFNRTNDCYTAASRHVFICPAFSVIVFVIVSVKVLVQ
ncbi:166_t:CDS:2, partial [Cetraspora pellucida]